MEQKIGDKWQRVDGGMSSETFLLDDGTGQVVIDPDCAEIMTDDYRRWRDGNAALQGMAAHSRQQPVRVGRTQDRRRRRHASWTRQATSTRCSRNGRADKPALLKRFDLDGNGQIDLKEWELARRAALREVRKTQQEIQSQPGVNIMRKPRDGRLFLLSDLEPEQLARRYGFWTLIQLVIALGAGYGLGGSVHALRSALAAALRLHSIRATRGFQQRDHLRITLFLRDVGCGLAAIVLERGICPAREQQLHALASCHTPLPTSAR